MRYKLLTILFLLINAVLFAQQQSNEYATDTVAAPIEELPTEYETKTEIVTEKKADYEELDTVLKYHSMVFTVDSSNLLQNDKKYYWYASLDSLLRDEKSKELNKPKPKEVSGGGSGVSWLGAFLNSGFAMILFFLLVALVIGFLVYKLFISDGAFARGTKKLKQVSEEEEIIVELNTESDFDKQIRLAVEQKNYRMAVRYQYLKTLHFLSQKGLVLLSADKTNFDYVNELINHPLRNNFAALTLHYDYVWYGEFEVDDFLYRKIETNFKEFNNSI